MSNRYVWVVAGGIMQIPMLKEIKSRGYKILLTDGNPDAPGKEYADQFVVLDTYDVFGHLNLASALQETPIAVLAVAADVGPTISAIADEFDLPAVDYEVAKSVRDKAKMREILGIDFPVWKEIQFNELEPALSWRLQCRRKGLDQYYPCVVKPLNGAGSKGVTIVKTPFKWDKATKDARAYTKEGNSFLVEQYIDAEIEIATDNFIIDGKVVFANAVKRYFSKDIFGLELGHLNPYTLNTEIKRKIEFAAKQLDVDYGPFKCDFIYNEKYGWVIAECATRLSGGFDHMYAANVATGKDITGFMLDVALGEKLSLRDKRLWNTNKKFAFTYAPILKPGKVADISIPECNSDEHPYLKYVFVTMKNDTIEPLINCTQRPLFIITEGDTEYQAIKNAKIIERNIKIEYE